MKLRINGNSIRIRLSRTEVDQLGSIGHLEEKTQFADTVFTYALKTKEGITALEAAFAGNTLTLFVPAGIPAVWATNDTVGYNANMPIGDGKTLFLLLEKDFKCLDNTMMEDQSDNYENPHTAC